MEQTPKTHWELVIDQINDCPTIDQADKETATAYIAEQGESGKIINSKARVDFLFVWNQTPQGREFWKCIDKNLSDGNPD